MNNTLTIIVPVLFFMFLGVMNRKTNLLSENDISSMKKIAVNIFLPMVLFYAFLTAKYTVEVIYYAAIMLFACATMFMVGKLLHKFFLKEHHYMPFLMTGFEIGMLGYALYTFLYGSENISNIALLDIGHGLFIFPIYFTLLGMKNNGTNLKDSLKFMSRTPLMLGFESGLI
jgi:predicted permease